MFMREQTVKKDGRHYKYLKVVESVWEKGRTKQVTVANLGSVTNWTEEKLHDFVKVLARFVSMEVFSLAEVDFFDCRSLGPFLILNHLWEEIGLDEIITQVISSRAVSLKARPVLLPVAKYVRAMVFNRLVDPLSKKGVSEWLPRDVFIPGLTPEDLSLHGYYRALEYLCDASTPIEQALHARFANLFNRDLSLVFYDLTSTYFEGTQCELAKYGYSRDHRTDCLQIEIGLLVDADGLTIGHRVFGGNVADVATVLGTLESLQEDFKVRRCIFVADDGMASEDNLKAIEDKGYEYITSLSLGKSAVGAQLMQTCPAKKDFTVIADNLLIHPLMIDPLMADETVRYIGTYNPLRTASTRRHRKERLRACLDYLKQRQELRSKRPSERSDRTTQQQATQLIATKRVQELIRLERDPQGNWVGRLNKEAIRKAKKQDGLVILQTNTKTLTDVEVATGYRTLGKVENAFRHIKNIIRLRPIRHWSDPMVLGHVCVCVLAYTLECLIERKLQHAKVPLSAREVIKEMQSLMVATLKTEQRQVTKRGNITETQQRILAAIGVPPVPAIWDEVKTAAND
jgi:transposase